MKQIKVSWLHACASLRRNCRSGVVAALSVRQNSHARGGGVNASRRCAKVFMNTWHRAHRLAGVLIVV
jgi:hypothetical protein